MGIDIIEILFSLVISNKEKLCQSTQQGQGLFYCKAQVTEAKLSDVSNLRIKSIPAIPSHQIHGDFQTKRLADSCNCQERSYTGNQILSCILERKEPHLLNPTPRRHCEVSDCVHRPLACRLSEAGVGAANRTARA